MFDFQREIKVFQRNQASRSIDQMARPIEATPILKGKDARMFLDQVRIEQPISAQRIEWLAKLAQQSKASEK